MQVEAVGHDRGVDADRILMQLGGLARQPHQVVRLGFETILAAQGERLDDALVRHAPVQHLGAVLLVAVLDAHGDARTVGRGQPAAGVLGDLLGPGVDQDGIVELLRIFVAEFLEPAALDHERVVIEIKALDLVARYNLFDLLEAEVDVAESHVMAMLASADDMVAAIGAVERAAAAELEGGGSEIGVDDRLVIADIAIHGRQLVEVVDKGGRAIFCERAIRAPDPQAGDGIDRRAVFQGIGQGQERKFAFADADRVELRQVVDALRHDRGMRPARDRERFPGLEIFEDPLHIVQLRIDYGERDDIGLVFG